jgi:hypothetical protein
MNQVAFPSITVLLGAGASKDAGLKLSAELTEELQSNVLRNRDEDLRRALGLIVGAIAFRRSVEGIDIHAPIDIETILRIAQQLSTRASHPLSGFVAAWHASLEQIAPQGNGASFERLISRAREILRDALKEPDDHARLIYLANIRRLILPSDPSDSYPEVFTLNYDRCLELGLTYERVPFTTGFEEGRWDQSQFSRTRCVRIYKLHGSFGWVRHPESTVLYDRDLAMARSDIDIASYDTEDELVFGTDNKLRAVQPFLWMAYRLSEAVARSKILIVIGYGFGDTYINQILSQAMATDPAKRLVAVAPDLTEKSIESAEGLQFLPERFHLVSESARSALLETDSLRKRIDELSRAGIDEQPFK